MMAIIAAITLVFDIKTIIIIIAGIGICAVWMLFIHNFKLLNKEKFEIINEMEKHLPFQPFAKEWEVLKQNKKYREETKLENVLPICFIIIYVALCIIITITKERIIEHIKSLDSALCPMPQHYDIFTGEVIPIAGQYEEVGPRGGKVNSPRTATIDYGDRLPPTQEKGRRWVRK